MKRNMAFALMWARRWGRFLFLLGVTWIGLAILGYAVVAFVGADSGQNSVRALLGRLAEPFYWFIYTGYFDGGPLLVLLGGFLWLVGRLGTRGRPCSRD